MADFAITDNLFARVSGMSYSKDGYVHLLDYGLTHPGSNVPVEQRPRRTSRHGAHWVADSTTAARVALRWEPTSTSRDQYLGRLHQPARHAGPRRSCSSANSGLRFDPFIQPSANADGGAWLTGKDGTRFRI